MEKEHNDLSQFLRSEDLAFSMENALLNNSMLEIESTDAGKIELDGKKYTKVSTRLQVLRKNLGFNVRIKTDLLHIDEKLVVAKAEISIFREGSWFEVATGHAEEKRDLSEINKFSAVENAETSAIGRALASLGLSGDEYASVEEIIFAKKRKEATDGSSSTTSKTLDKKEPKASPSLINYIIKLLRETSTETDKFLAHYGVRSINELTTTQAEEGMNLLKRKKKSSIQQKAIDQSKKDQQAEVLSVLQENESKEAKVKVFKKVSVDDGQEEMVEKELPPVKSGANDGILMDDETDELENSEIVEEAESQVESEINVEVEIEELEKSDEKSDEKETKEEDSNQNTVEEKAEKIKEETSNENTVEETKEETSNENTVEETKEEKSTPASRGRKPSNSKSSTGRGRKNTQKKEDEDKPASTTRRGRKGSTSKSTEKKDDDKVEPRKNRPNDLDDDDDIVI